MLNRIGIVIIIAGIMPQVALSQSQNGRALANLMQSSEVIAFADLQGGSVKDRVYSTEIVLKRVIKGKELLLPGSAVRVDYPAYDSGSPINPAEIDESGLVFMTSGPAGWRLRSVNSSGRGLRSGFLPIKRGTEIPFGPEESLAVSDAITQILVAAIEAEGPFGELGPKLLVSPTEHPDVYRRWSKSADLTLRVFGLTGRVIVGDEAAIVETATEWPTLSMSPRSGLLGSALSAVRTSSPNVLRSLGKLATGADGPPKEVRQGVAYALSSIHTADTLPFLAQLLEAEDVLTQSLAVGGFSAFVTNMRTAQGGADAAAARDEVLNPGRRRTLPDANAPFETEETRRFLHFGPFNDPLERAEYLDFWKTWYTQNRPELETAR